MSNSNNDGKREIKIYKKTYRLPTLSGGKLDQLQQQIRQHNEHLTQGKLVVELEEVTVPEEAIIIEKEEKWGLFGKKLIKHERKITRQVTKTVKKRIRQRLSFEESYTELDQMIRNYDLMVNFLKHSENDYQRFFRDLAEEVCEVITEKSNGILEDEREAKELKRRSGDNPAPERIARLQEGEQALFEAAKSYGYGAVLILKKLDLMSETLKLITSEQDKDKERLAIILEEMRLDRDIYAFQIRARKKLEEAEKFANLALNFEESLRPVMGDIQGLLSQIAQADQKLVKSVSEIQNIANLIENKQFVGFEKDRDSENLINFLMTSEMKKGRMEEVWDRMQGVNPEADFDAKLFTTGKELTISDCLGNIREFLDMRLDKFKTLSVSAVEVNEPDLIFDTYTSNDLTLDLGNGIILELVRVSGGSFMMGSPDGEGDSDERPQHRVTLQEFLIGKYTVTNAQWQAVMATKGSANCDQKFQGANQPVVGVSWHDAKKFCDEVSRRVKKNVRLPSEAEWEYACRARTTTAFHFGETITPKLVNYDGNYPYGDAPKGEYRQKTVDVDSFSPNAWGLYQMHGNVWEWCEDVWHENYNGAPTDGSAWLTGGGQNRHVVRGGSWGIDAYNCRSAYRSRIDSDGRYLILGFRVIL